MKIFKYVTLLSLCLLVLSSCKPSEKDEHSLRLNLAFEPVSLDWNLANDSYSFDVINNLMLGLSRFSIGANGEVISEPACAKTWTVNKNATDFVFELNPLCNWNDGRRVQAQDFIDSFQRILDPNTSAPYADLLSMIDMEETQAIDEDTLRIKLKHPTAYFLYLTSSMITLPIRKDLIERYGDDWTSPQNLVTNGPFKLKSWQHEYKIVLERDTSFQLDGKPAKNAIRQLKFFMVAEQSSAFSLFRNKQLDLIDNRSIPNSEIKNLSAYTEGEERLQVPLLRNTYLGFNTVKAPFNNPKLRKAFGYAIDREQIVKILARGHQANASWIPPGLKNFYNADFAQDSSTKQESKLKKARQLLDEVRKEYKQKGKDLDAELSQAEFLFPSSEEAKLLSEALQAMWQKNLGIQIKLSGMEWKVFLDTLKRDTPTLFRLNWGADFPDPDTFMQVFSSSNQTNYGKWSNQEYDKLVQDAVSTVDLGLRQSLYRRAEQILLDEDTVIVPLFVNTQTVLKTKELQGLSINPMDIIRLDLVTKGK